MREEKNHELKPILSAWSYNDPWGAYIAFFFAGGKKGPGEEITAC